VSRVFAQNDPGNAFRKTDAAPVKIGGIYKDDGGQFTFTDGQGNKYWFADTTGGNVTVTLPDATTVTADTIYTVKRTTGGSNTLTVATDGGNIDGVSTHSIPAQYASFSYVSDGTNYFILNAGFMARAWVNFNGTGTIAIRASGNVSSLTDSGTGTYSVNLTTAMPDRNYASISDACDAIYYVFSSSYDVSTSEIGIGTFRQDTNVLFDASIVSLSVFR
jgi:hypothetical protein